MIYSLYEVLDYLRCDLRLSVHPVYIQYIYPLATRLLEWQPKILELATHLEVLVAPWLILSVFSSGIILPILWIGFLRAQYLVSPKMRLTISQWNELLERGVQHPSCPKMLRRVYGIMKTTLKKPTRVPARSTRKI